MIAAASRSLTRSPIRGALERRFGASFTPADLFASGEAGAWYDPSDLSTVWQDSGRTTAGAVDSPVGAIDDKSGNGNHATQATAAARPILRQDANGDYYLEADGVDDELLTASGAFGASIADGLVAAAYHEVTRLESCLFNLDGGGDFTTRWLAHAPYSDGVGYFDTGGNASPNRVAATWPVAAGTNLVASFKCSVADSTQFIRVNQSEIASDASGHTVSVSGSASIMAGKVSTTVKKHMNVRLYGFVFVKAAVGLSDVERAESWLADKAGVTL